MTDLARRIPMATPTNQPIALSQDTPLKLSGGIPQTVIVKIAEVDGKLKALFSLPGGDTHPSIEWKCGGYALLITFVFDQNSVVEISELIPVTPSFWFSDKYTPVVDAPQQQGCCLLSIPGTYHFNVKGKPSDTSGVGILSLMIDPQIVVTPL
jgi:hypothetical protein